MKDFFGKRSFMIVTGASRGLGFELAKTFSSKLAAGSSVVLAARNSDLLKKNCDSLAEKFPEITFDSFVSINEEAKVQDYEAIFDEYLTKTSPEAVVVVHNAGSLGNINSLLSNQNDGAEIDRYFQANVRHPMLLSSVAISKTKVPLFMINISSICGVNPVTGVGLYCIAKAARKMYFSCLAVENPNVRILQYSPGPLETDMMGELRSSDLSSVSSMAKGFKEDGRLLTVEQTTLKLCEILEKGDYESGDHLDYFDR